MNAFATMSFFIRNKCVCHRHRHPVGRKRNKTSQTVLLTCWRVRKGSGVVTQLLSLLTPAVNPDAETHENDPAGSTDAGNECWLLDHIGYLLSQAYAALLVTVTAASTVFFSSHRGQFSW